MKTIQVIQAAILVSFSIILASLEFVAAHSWIEYAYKIAPNGTMIGEIGYARGYLPRNSTDPLYSDSIPEQILPYAGDSAYTGEEIINKYLYNATPEYPMLEANAGDYIALMHLENGHVTLPQNQPLKPRNRGIIYIYGTNKPAEHEKLFDVHLLWNQNGTGGDGRGTLLATRNYDDGQCYQPNDGTISTDRAEEFAHLGAIHAEELACQSDIKLPDDLKEGDIYTIYWYWDWPDLNSEFIDLNATTDGIYPWAGTFMRGEKDPHGFTEAAIAKNESYSSVIDIKIVGSKGATDYETKDMVLEDYVADQNIYRIGIKGQMESNYQVPVNEPGEDVVAPTGSALTDPVTGSATKIASATAAPVATTTASANPGIATVTVTTTVSPKPSVTTVYITVPADEMTGSTTTTPQSTHTVVKTITTTRVHASTTTASTRTVTQTLTKTRGQADAPAASPSSASTVTLSVIPTPATSSTATVVKTLTTHIHRTSTIAAAPGITTASTTSVSFAGGQFQETPGTTSTGHPTPTPFLRRRSYWGFLN